MDSHRNRTVVSGVFNNEASYGRAPFAILSDLQSQLGGRGGGMVVGAQEAVSGNSIVYEQSVLWNKLYYRVDAKHSLLFGTIVVVVLSQMHAEMIIIC